MTKFRRRYEVIDAFQHDGSDERAMAFKHWIEREGGKVTVFLRGEYEPYPREAVARIEDPAILQNLIVPGWWVVRLDKARYYPMSDKVFQEIYMSAPDIADDVVLPEAPRKANPSKYE